VDFGTDWRFELECQMQNNRKQVDLEAVHTLLSFSRMACRQAGDEFPSKETTISSLLSDSETWNDTQSKFHFHSAKNLMACTPPRTPSPGSGCAVATSSTSASTPFIRSSVIMIGKRDGTAEPLTDMIPPAKSVPSSEQQLENYAPVLASTANSNNITYGSQIIFVENKNTHRLARNTNYGSSSNNNNNSNASSTISPTAAHCFLHLIPISLINQLNIVNQRFKCSELNELSMVIFNFFSSMHLSSQYCHSKFQFIWISSINLIN